MRVDLIIVGLLLWILADVAPSYHRNVDAHRAHDGLTAAGVFFVLYGMITRYSGQEEDE